MKKNVCMSSVHLKDPQSHAGEARTTPGHEEDRAATVRQNQELDTSSWSALLFWSSIQNFNSFLIGQIMRLQPETAEPQKKSSRPDRPIKPSGAQTMKKVMRETGRNVQRLSLPAVPSARRCVTTSDLSLVSPPLPLRRD